MSSASTKAHATREAIEAALGGWSAAGHVVVAIPDATRPLDVRPALAALSDRVRGRLDVVVGLGLHRPMTPGELAPLAPWSPRQSDPDETDETEVVDGIPGSITRGILGADAIVSVGVCELHQYAGVSGGHKGVSVGCGGRRTVAALHARARVLDPAVRLGQVDGNPFRAAVDALGMAAGCALTLSHLPATGDWLWGEPSAVVRDACSRLRPWSPVARSYAGAVLRVPDSKASSLYQASRAASYLALSPRPPLREGAVLAVVAGCPEGLGAEAGWRAALASCSPPWTPLLTGPEPQGAGAQRAVILAALAQRFRLVVVGAADPAPLRAVGVEVWPVDRLPGLLADPDWIDVPEPFARLPQQIGH